MLQDQIKVWETGRMVVLGQIQLLSQGLINERRKKGLAQRYLKTGDGWPMEPCTLNSLQQRYQYNAPLKNRQRVVVEKKLGLPRGVIGLKA